MTSAANVTHIYLIEILLDSSVVCLDVLIATVHRISCMSISYKVSRDRILTNFFDNL